MRGAWFMLLVFALVSLDAPCKADELRWLSPPDCTSRAAALQEIERLVGEPLAEGKTADFEVVVSRGPAQAVSVVLQTHRHASGEVRTRTLSAGSCAEAQDMAAVAIALAIAGQEPVEALAPEAARVPPAPKASQQADAAPVPKPARPPAPWIVGLGAQLALEYGALPEWTVGGAAEVSVNHRALRLIALGSYFAPRQERLPPDGRGGEFTLAFGGLLGCYQHGRGRAWFAVCGGGELGKIKAEGIDLRNSRVQDGAWQALRADFGAGWEFSPDVRLNARLGVAVPLVRQQFTIDDDTLVHRPGPVSLRGLLGVEFLL